MLEKTSSQRRGPGPAGAAGGLLLALLGAVVPLAGAQEAATGGRVEGEYGLHVTLDADTLRVWWLTRRPGVGWARLVTRAGEQLPELTPGTGVQHSARFLRPPGDTVLLRYGSRDDAADRHETSLRLDLSPARPPVVFEDVDSVFVISDVHGGLDTLQAVLRNARVVDGDNRWSAGRSHLVVVGDMVDRGPNATAVLWFLYGLEPQAARAGGALHILLGNHEVMVLLGDLRDVHPKERGLATLHGVGYDRLLDPRRSILGTWLVSKPAILRIDDVLFAHGGVSEDYLGFTLEAFDDSLAAVTSEELFYRWADTSYVVGVDSVALEWRNELFWGERSPLWYRGYASTDSLATALGSVLDHFGAELHVVGHTPFPTITPRYDGRLIGVNTLPFAAELLLLVRTGDRHERWRFRSAGPPERPL